MGQGPSGSRTPFTTQDPEFHPSPSSPIPRPTPLGRPRDSVLLLLLPSLLSVHVTPSPRSPVGSFPTCRLHGPRVDLYKIGFFKRFLVTQKKKRPCKDQHEDGEWCTLTLLPVVTPTLPPTLGEVGTLLYVVRKDLPGCHGSLIRDGRQEGLDGNLGTQKDKVW